MEYPKSPLNKIKRGVKKASYEKEAVHKILDASEVCHVAFLVNGRAHTQPINFGRLEEVLYLHGSLKNRMTQSIIEAGEVTVSVFLMDSMKLTRSAYHHSVNFRSVVVFGSVREIVSDEEKLIGLKSIINHFVPDRWEHCRPPNEKELKSTRVVAIDIDTASAKVADSPLTEWPEDYELDYWAGEIPTRLDYGSPEPDERLSREIEVPQHVHNFVNSQRRSK